MALTELGPEIEAAKEKREAKKRAKFKALNARTAVKKAAQAAQDSAGPCESSANKLF